MKKQLIILTSILALFFSACEKDSIFTFTAVMQQPVSADKTSITDNGSNFSLTWNPGDQINMNNNNGSGWLVLTTDHNEVDTKAKFKISTDGEEFFNNADHFTAYYPASLVNDLGQTVLPAIQNYKAGQFDGFPMMAETTGKTDELEFKNICGGLQIQLKGNFKVTKIELVANEGMSGAFNVTGGVAQVSGTQGIELDCPSIQLNPSSATNFYIYLPANTYHNMKILVYNDEAGYYTLNAGDDMTIAANTIYPTPINIESSKGHYTYTKAVFHWGELYDYLHANHDDTENIIFEYGSSVNSGTHLESETSTTPIYGNYNSLTKTYTISTSAKMISSEEDENNGNYIAGAFSDLVSLKTVNFGDRYNVYNVEYINNLFANCSALQSVYLGRSFNLEEGTEVNWAFLNTNTTFQVYCTRKTKDALTNITDSYVTASQIHVID